VDKPGRTRQCTAKIATQKLSVNEKYCGSLLASPRTSARSDPVVITIGLLAEPMPPAETRMGIN
jgi:hypothetical protein